MANCFVDFLHRWASFGTAATVVICALTGSNVPPSKISELVVVVVVEEEEDVVVEEKSRLLLLLPDARGENASVVLLSVNRNSDKAIFGYIVATYYIEIFFCGGGL